MDKPNIQEREHLRGALGLMFRGENGKIQIHPHPNKTGLGLSGPVKVALRRNAQIKVVQTLIDKGWLVETEHQFVVTDAGREALDGVGG